MKSKSKVLLFIASLMPIFAGFNSCQKDTSEKTALIPSEQAPLKEELVSEESEQNTQDEDSTPAITLISSEAEFNSLIKQKTIIKFTAPYCGACKTIEPTYQAVASNLKKQYKFATIDVTHLDQIAERYKIKGIPTFLFFKHGNLLPEKVIGASVSREQFKEKIIQAFAD